jgi:MFS family permease
MTTPADFASPAVDESSPRYDGWRVTAVCFVVAMFCWGFGLYSHGIYLAELQRLFGWSTSLISGATTAYYLLTASLVVFISDAIVQLGPRRVFLLGTCCLGSAVTLLAFIVVPWQLYLVYLIMAVGSAAMHVGAITNVLGLWFDRRRGLAISLALNGASSGGIFVAPTLIVAIAETGFAAAMVGAATSWRRFSSRPSPSGLISPRYAPKRRAFPPRKADRDPVLRPRCLVARDWRRCKASRSGVWRDRSP